MLRHPPFNAQDGLDVETLCPRVPLSGWSQPSLVCRGAMPWADQRVRAREPVGALSRDAQAPPPLTPKLATSRKKKGTMNRHKTTSITGRKHGPKINARGVHATGSDPSGLGIMQPEGRPQQSELRT